MRRPDRLCPSTIVLAILLLAGVLFRVGLILAWPQRIANSDAAQYLTLAANLASGNGYSLWPSAPFDPDVYRSPGYPLFLAFLMKCGLGMIGMAAVQVWLEMVSYLTVARMVAWRFGVGAARLGFVIALFCPFTASLPMLFLSESLALPLVNLLFAAALSGASPRRSVLLGISLGLLCLCRGGFLPAIPLAMLAVALPRTAAFGGRLGCAALLLVGALLPLLPYGAWNLEHHGRFSLTPPAGLGRAMWGGVCQMEIRTQDLPNDVWNLHEAIWGDGSHRPSSRELLAADQAMMQEAREAIGAHPLGYAWGVMRHEIHIWAGERFLFPFTNPVSGGWALRLLGIAMFAASLLAAARRRHLYDLWIAGLSPALSQAMVLPWMYVIMRYTSVLFGPFAFLTAIVIADAAARRPVYDLADRRSAT